MADTRVLFVVPYPLGEVASQRFRFEQYLPEMVRKGFFIQIIPFWGSSTWALLYRKGKIIQKIGGVLQGFLRRFLLLSRLHQYDYVFIHREATPIGPPWFEWVAVKVLRKKIIFDFDDAIWLPNTSAGNKVAGRLKWHQKTAAICRWSYKISCGNSYLRQYALQYNNAAILVPTTIDTLRHHNRQKQQNTDKVIIGWTGSHSTLPYLKLLEPVLQQLEQQYRFEFVVIADRKPDLKLASFKYKPWSKETEIEDLLRFNIGIMPLPDSEWAKGKCAFKALQYMALGIPAVVSGVGANTTVVLNGATGYCCNSPEEWYLSLENLLVNPDLRAAMGVAGQAHVGKHFSVTANQKTFLGLFS